MFYMYLALQTFRTLACLRCYIWKISENFRGSARLDSAQIFFGFGSVKIRPDNWNTLRLWLWLPGLLTNQWHTDGTYERFYLPSVCNTNCHTLTPICGHMGGYSVKTSREKTSMEKWSTKKTATVKTSTRKIGPQKIGPSNFQWCGKNVHLTEEKRSIKNVSNRLELLTAWQPTTGMQ